MSEYRDLNVETPTLKSTVTNVESVYQALDNLISTLSGERLFNPAYGGNLEDLLFELLNEETAFLIETRLFESVDDYLPYITLLSNKSSVEPNYDEDKYEVKIYYQLKSGSDNVYEYATSLPRKEGV
jgi:phage baseplate assembly protein W